MGSTIAVLFVKDIEAMYLKTYSGQDGNLYIKLKNVNFLKNLYRESTGKPVYMALIQILLTL